MLFKSNFYSIISTLSEGEEVVFKITIDKDHKIFNGHFPDNPVTPGVVQMEIVKELTSNTLNNDVALQTMSNCKFLAILNPVETSEVNVVLKINEDEGLVKVNAVFKNDSTVFTKMSAQYHRS